MPATEQGLLERAQSERWYHTIELAPDVVSDGDIDHRPVASKILPHDLSGKRALDIGTFDGFWAFELERRGAAEVVAADLGSYELSDWPPHARERLTKQVQEGKHYPSMRFGLAHTLLDSGVRFEAGSIYDLDADALGGPFDFVFIGDLLMHLRDPVAALDRVRSVMAPGGVLVNVEAIAWKLSVISRKRAAARLRAAENDYDWWVPNIACLRNWVELGGFSDTRRLATWRSKARDRGMRQWHVALESHVPND